MNNLRSLSVFKRWVFRAGDHGIDDELLLIDVRENKDQMT